MNSKGLLEEIQDGVKIKVRYKRNAEVTVPDDAKRSSRIKKMNLLELAVKSLVSWVRTVSEKLLCCGLRND